ncbi:MAG: hypothetical protein U9O98_10325 [Asgard group archaeon]|nr:hypothetical protein [Asgard group archaeon]
MEENRKKTAKKYSARFKYKDILIREDFSKGYEKLGKTEYDSPPEIKEIEALLFSRGKINAAICARKRRKFLMPSWVRKMLSPESKGVISMGHCNSLTNNNYRDWVAFGALKGDKEGIVTKCGLVIPTNNYGLIMGIIDDSQPSYLIEAYNNKQKLLEGYIPFIINDWLINGKKFKQTVFATKENDNEIGTLSFMKVGSNKGKESILLSIRPFNHEGVSLINSIRYIPIKQEIIINNQWHLKLSVSPVDITMGRYSDRYDSAKIISKKKVNGSSDITKEIEIQCSIGLANMTFRFNEEISKINIYFSMYPNKKPTIIKQQKTIDKWKEKIQKGLLLKTGNDEFDRLFLVSKANLLLLLDSDTITPGPTIYHRFWCRDAAFLINSLDLLGYHKDSQRVLPEFISRQRNDGFYYSHEGEFDSPGQGIWALVEHGKLTQNNKWLKKVFPSIKKAAKWIIKNRKEGKEKLPQGMNPLSKGLLPPGYSAEHLGECDYFYWDNFWGVAGLREVAECAKIVNNQDYDYFREEYISYRNDLLESVKKVYKKWHFLPASPFREDDSAIIGNLCAYHPTKVLSAKSPILKDTTEKLWNDYCIHGGFFHEVAWNCYGTYLTMHLAESFLALNMSDKVLKILEWLQDNITCAMGWAEGISPKTREGGMGDSPHGWASADWIALLRNLFIRETYTKKLIFLSGFPSKLLKIGVEIQNAPTYYGKISYQAKIKDNILELQFNKKPKSLPIIQIMTPRAIRNVTLDNQKITKYNKNSVSITNSFNIISIELAEE